MHNIQYAICIGLLCICKVYVIWCSFSRAQPRPSPKPAIYRPVLRSPTTPGAGDSPIQSGQAPHRLRGVGQNCPGREGIKNPPHLRGFCGPAVRRIPPSAGRWPWRILCPGGGSPVNDNCIQTRYILLSPSTGHPRSYRR